MTDKCKYLTPFDTRYISQIAGDIQSGNHLLRPRSEAYWEYWNKMVAARKAVEDGTATDKEKEIVEYEKQSGDYFYWKHLPQDKKLFIEED
jgi:hypothetical protein